MPISVTIKPVRASDKRAQAKLRELRRKVKNPSQANRRVSVWLLRWVHKNFKTEGGEVGGWLPFKLGGRRRKGGAIDASAKLLQDTGRLRASFIPFYSRTNAGIGSSLPYAEAHDQGLPGRGLPARRLLPRQDDNEVAKKVVEIYDFYIKEVIE